MTGKVIRISRMHATIEILIIDGETVPYPFTGTIRKLDVRQTDIDNIRMETCFLPGDVESRGDFSWRSSQLHA